MNTVEQAGMNQGQRAEQEYNDAWSAFTAAEQDVESARHLLVEARERLNRAGQMRDEAAFTRSARA